MTFALIDGDLLLYQSCSAVEAEVSWEDDYHLIVSRREEVMQLVKKRHDAIAETLQAEPVVIFGDAENWRKQLDPTYKANRKSKRKPLAFREVRAWMDGAFKIKGPFPTLEGDDVMGVIATMYGPEKAIMVTNDKDLRQIPGRITDMNCTEITTITEAEADYWHMRQTLTGDAVDGYPGCPGVGPVKAEQILDFDAAPGCPNNWWPAVVAAFKKAKLTEDDALLQARLARIVRHGEYNTKTKKVKLWVPPPVKLRSEKCGETP